MVSRSAAHGKLSFLALRLDGIPIAMLCDLYSEGLGYSYKTVFDNELADFSPGGDRASGFFANANTTGDILAIFLVCPLHLFWHERATMTKLRRGTGVPSS